MRKLFSALLLIFASFLVTSAQNQKIIGCPKLEINFPFGGYLAKGERYYITAGIDGYNSEDFKYDWNFSIDLPISGQGNPVISFVADEEFDGSTVKATVEIKGLPENCPNVISDSFQIHFDPGVPLELDDYKAISFSKEKVRLDATVARIKKLGNSNIHFVIYYTSKQTEQVLKNRVSKIQNYLLLKHKIFKESVTYIFGESDEVRTRVIVFPAK